MAQPPVRTPASPPTQGRQSAVPAAQQQQVNIHGQPPQPNMAPDEPVLEGLSDNTKAEMDAGKKVLGQRRQRDDAEHTAGKKHLEPHAARQGQRQGAKPPEEDDEFEPT
jgi:hypothetical protein